MLTGQLSSQNQLWTSFTESNNKTSLTGESKGEDVNIFVWKWDATGRNQKKKITFV